MNRWRELPFRKKAKNERIKMVEKKNLSNLLCSSKIDGNSIFDTRVRKCDHIHVQIKIYDYTTFSSCHFSLCPFFFAQFEIGKSNTILTSMNSRIMSLMSITMSWNTHLKWTDQTNGKCEKTNGKKSATQNTHDFGACRKKIYCF